MHRVLGDSGKLAPQNTKRIIGLLANTWVTRCQSFPSLEENRPMCLTGLVPTMLSCFKPYLLQGQVQSSQQESIYISSLPCFSYGLIIIFSEFTQKFNFALFKMYGILLQFPDSICIVKSNCPRRNRRQPKRIGKF